MTTVPDVPMCCCPVQCPVGTTCPGLVECYTGEPCSDEMARATRASYGEIPECGPVDAGRAGSCTTDLKIRRIDMANNTTKVGCIDLPLKSGGVLRFTWARLAGMGSADLMYNDFYRPGGAGGVFAFMPVLNQYETPADGRRTHSVDGSLVYDANNAVQTEFEVSAKRDTTYFTEFYERSATYFEYYAGSGISPTEKVFGRPSRRYDLDGNELKYHYVPNPENKPLLDKITGDFAGTVIPYFHYENTTHPAPITKIHLVDTADATKNRTAYFDYQFYVFDKYLKKITYPDGCVKQVDPMIPFLDYRSSYEIKREVDQEGYQTYFEYGGTLLQKTIEPEGRNTYYDYDTPWPWTLTKKRFEGRNEEFFGYTRMSSLGERILTNRHQDPVGNVTYWEYDTTLGRPTKRIEANKNVTYYEYKGGSAGNKYALTKQVSQFDGASTYFGYPPGVYDVAKRVNARGNPTYYEYDSLRHRTSTIDALNNKSQEGWDSAGRRTKIQDARSNTTYFNYSPTTHLMDSQIDAEGDTTYFGQDGFGNQTRHVSPRWPEQNYAAFTTYHEYDQRNRRTKEIDALNQVTYFDWTPRGDPLATVDARGTEIEYAYNGLRLLTQETVTDLSGTQLTQAKHGYNVYKNRTKTQDALGNTTYFSYDQIDRLTQTQDALGNQTKRFYDSVSNLTEETDARGNTAYFFYDSLSRRKAQRDALANITYFTHDLNGNRTVIKDARGNATYHAYDALDRTSATQDALAGTAYFEYDAVSNRTRAIDPRGNASQTFYDALNRPASQRDPLGNTAYFAYDRSGNRSRMMDPRGNATYWTYDRIDRPTITQDAQGNPTYFGYDPVGSRTALRNALGHSTYFGYDGLRRNTRVQDALGKTTYFEYNPVSRITRTIDPNNRATLMRYDVLHRQDAILYPDTGSVYFHYDQVGNVSKVQDARSNPTYFGYDAVNRPVRMQDALSRTLYFEYDPVSNYKKFIGAEGESAEFTYDALNRRTNILYTPAGSVVSDGLRSDPYFVYDSVGNVTKMGDLWGLHRMEFDADNRRTRHQYPDQSTIYFEYDPNSNVTALVYPGAAGRSGRDFDSLNRQTKVQAPSGNTAYFTYNAVHNLTQRRYGNNATCDVTYDNAERIESWKNKDASSSNLTQFTYGRDAKGLIVKSVREATHTVYYSYDANDRLTSEIWGSAGGEVYAFKYSYDLAGNRLRSKINGEDTYFSYDQANQLTVKGSNAVYATPTYYTYDQNGSQTKETAPDGTTYFGYNAAGLIAKILWKDASRTYFYYDANLQRYAMDEHGTLAYFLWDGLDILQERQADGTVKAEHTHAKTPIPGIGQLVETYRPLEAAADQKIYSIMDMRGTITKWVKSDGSTLVASREYDAFGRVIAFSGIWPSKFCYQGQAWMEITSANDSQRLLLSPTRLYNPADGVFPQSDPLLRNSPLFPLPSRRSSVRSLAPVSTPSADLQHFVGRDGLGFTNQLGVYTYAHNNPITKADPTGLQQVAIPLGPDTGLTGGATGPEGLPATPPIPDPGGPPGPNPGEPLGPSVDNPLEEPTGFFGQVGFHVARRVKCSLGAGVILPATDPRTGEDIEENVTVTVGVDFSF